MLPSAVVVPGNYHMYDLVCHISDQDVFDNLMPHWLRFHLFTKWMLLKNNLPYSLSSPYQGNANNTVTSADVAVHFKSTPSTEA